MSSTNFSSRINHCHRELIADAVMTGQDVGYSLQMIEYPKSNVPAEQVSSAHSRRHEAEEDRRFNVSVAPSSGSSVLNQECSPTNDSRFCNTLRSPGPLCRQFWKAGHCDDSLHSKPITHQNGGSYLRIHPKFLHSNATSHKWVFGAIAELLDNSVDEIQNGATFVMVDKILNPRDGTPALLIQDNGGGMDPDAMRHCISFGFSNKKSKTAIGQYGNGFKTSSMRLGADVVVFSRCTRDRKLTQSVGLLSYTFLRQTLQDQIVVPMADYQFDMQTGTWNTLNPEQHFKSNLSILLQWSPASTEAELLKQCDAIGPHGTKIIIYNLWHNDEGKLELDFESDPQDILISRTDNNITKISQPMSIFEQHLANRLQYSLRAYLSVLYLRVPVDFFIFLRGQVVEYHNIANDLKFPEFILYKPQHMEDSVITAIGFLKEAPEVNIHGFNVYHKNRLILPYWRVVSTFIKSNKGRGVVGVLEANFILPAHNKQDFEKTPAFQKLESRLKDMTLEYWEYHCGLIGYQAITKRALAKMTHAASSGQGHGTYQPVLLSQDHAAAEAGAIQHENNASLNHSHVESGMLIPSTHRTSSVVSLKRKRQDHAVDPEGVKMGVAGCLTTDTTHSGHVQNQIDHGTQLADTRAIDIIQENRKLRAQCLEFEKTQEELNLKVMRLKEEIQQATREYAHLLLDSKLLERMKLVK